MYGRVFQISNGSRTVLLRPCRWPQTTSWFWIVPEFQVGSVLSQGIRTSAYRTDPFASSTALPQNPDIANSNVASENTNVVASQIIYSPLVSGQMRTVTLHPGGYSDPLRCSLNVVSLEHPPRYQALSYVWGSRVDPATIFLNNQPFRVTKSLNEALMQLRSPTKDSTLWVDALCIDQENIPERNTQVQQMRTIYANADRVLLWLGPEADDSDLVIAMLRLAQEHGFDSGFMTTLVQSDLFLFLPLVSLLFARAYWFRVWVVQEVAYAKDVLLVCGPHQIPYTSVLKFIDTLKRHDIIKLALSHPSRGRYTAAISTGGPNSLMSPGSARTQEYPAADWLLNQFSGKLCHDPRDKIFGFWGLFSPELRSRVTVDYSKCIPEVYRSATEAIIKTTKRLDVTCWPRCEGAAPGHESDQWVSKLPSWVPNWNAHYSGQPFAFDPYHHGYSASGSQEAFYRFLDNGATLQAKGICLGTIGNIQQQTVVDYLHAIPLHSDLISVWKYVVGCKDRLNISLDSVEGDTLISTLTAGQFRIMVERHPTVHAEFNRLFVSTLPRSSDRLNIQIPQPGDNFLRMMYYPLLGRSLFTLGPGVNDGRTEGAISDVGKVNPSLKMGLAPNTANNGDKICILLGCRTPVVLRPTGRYHIILGDAYVHGCMHGEAVRAFEAGSEPLDDFFLH